MENENNNVPQMNSVEKKKGGAWSIIVIIILIVIALIALFGKKPAPISDVKDNATTTTQVINISASDGTNTVAIAFNNSDIATDTVTFIWDGITYNLPIAMSGSGARYSNSFTEVDKGMELWEHQGEITISNDGQTLFVGKETTNQ